MSSSCSGTAMRTAPRRSPAGFDRLSPRLARRLNGGSVDANKLLEFLRRHRLAVQASVSAAGGPQAAVVGFAATDSFEIVCDTLDSTRKVRNLRQNNRVALVIGGSNDG